uniref:Uncharacterized protein n=1 Tax=Scophthalmus maximus TaxID=52904 RepID=A0A8D3DIN3_SCOMX
MGSWHRGGTAFSPSVKTHRSGFRHRTMASSSRCVGIVLFLLSAVTSDTRGVFGRAVDARGFVSGSQGTADGSSGPTLRTDAARRWRRGVEERHRERCAELPARPFSAGAARGPVFPGQPLFNFVRRVYQCCQEGQLCRSVKGIQGRLRGGRDVEFLFTREILSLTVTRAELHLQLSVPQHLDVRPVLPSMAKRSLPTRYSVWSRGNRLELRVDLLFLFQSLQEAAGGAGGGPSLVNMRRALFSSRADPPGENPAPRALQDTDGHAWGDGAANAPPAVELGLVLGCSQAGVGVSCGGAEVRLSHTPFMALYYR